MKLPVKDPNTIPWMTPREIPAIKAVLSRWRRMRRDKEFSAEIREEMLLADASRQADASEWSAAWHLEYLAAIDERLRKEQGK